MKMISLNYAFMLFFVLCGFSNAEVKVADIFSDHMVLQQGVPIPVWGKAQPKEKISVKLGNLTVRTNADKNGKWKVELDSQKASGKPLELTVEGSSSVKFRDVLIGEVWIASGQSNMEWKLKSCAKHLPQMKEHITNANFPQIRFRNVKVKESLIKKDTVNDNKSWHLCTPETASEFSAAAFFFARKIHKKLNVPVGIIETAWGGHPIEPFIPTEAYTGHPVLEEELKLGKANDLEGLRTMVGGVYARNNSWLPGTVFNSRIAPVIPYAVKGAIWYQAESNCGKGEDPRFYNVKMKALMKGWRTQWNAPQMPFYFVQLPQYNAPNWVYMRNEQRLALQDNTHTGMAVTIDLKLGNIHPANKYDVGERLANLPLQKDYGLKIQSQGPLYKSLKIDGKKVTVSFNEIGSGLSAGVKEDFKPTVLNDSKTITGFELSDSSGRWVKANAEISGNKIVCTSELKSPVAVRYAWGTHMTDTIWNLYNKEGMPASPFISHLELSGFKLQ